MQNIPLASSSIDSNNNNNNILLVSMNGNNPTTTTNSNNNGNNVKLNPALHQQQPLFINNSQSFPPRQTNTPQQPMIFFQNHLLPQTLQSNSVQHHPIPPNLMNN